MPAAEAALRDVVLLTGSSGCLGQHTLKLLLSHDDKTEHIRCLDLRPPSKELASEVELLVEQLATNKLADSNKSVKYFTGDIRDINLLESILSDMRVSCIIHCASKVDIWRLASEQNSNELESINVGGTENLLKCCIRFGVPKFVHVSSYETFVSYHTIYYATENTIPEPVGLSFGASGRSKKLAEAKVRQYANNKLRPFRQPARPMTSSNDFLNAVIVRYTPIYGENDQYFVSKYLEIAKFFSGKLQRFSNIWIRQQPIYVGNAAWALICAKNKMDIDETISGEDFHITDDTPIGDPFEFLQPFLECKSMRLSESTLPGLPVWLLVFLFFWLANLLKSLDVFNLFTRRGGRLQEAIERDQKLAKAGNSKATNAQSCQQDDDQPNQAKHWYHLITPEMFFFTINSLFLNRTKASLRLNYEPLFDYKTSHARSLAWYRDCLKL